MSQFETINTSAKKNGLAPRENTTVKKAVKRATGPDPWTGTGKILFRFAFIYFFIQSVPLDWKFYRDLFSIDWFQLHFYDLLNLTRYSPKFPYLTGFNNWIAVLLIAAAGSAAWTYYDRGKSREYVTLNYALRVILRYRLAVGIIAYGLIKLFPLQMPYPSLSALHTNYGEFLPWKIYYNTIAVTPWYESFLGAVEIFAGLLLFNRRTATFGAGIAAGFIGNVMAANFGYNIGEQVYSAYLLLIAFYLLAYDLPRLYSLLIEQRFTRADNYIPPFAINWAKRTRIALKGAFILFILLFGYKTYSNYRHDPYLIPPTAGLAGAYGFYNVREFKLNHRSIPYSLTDPNRWQNVVFEKWATLSVRIARPVKLDLSNGNGVHQSDLERNYEEAGVGDRLYFSYQADTVNHTLLLQNKNPNYKGDRLILHYSRPDPSTILLSGIDENKDSIYVGLDKVVKKYMLFEGRRKPLKL
jgi:hypothetical protein